MNEASVLMPRLFDIGMHSGDPLIVLRNKLAHVSKMKNNSQTKTQCNNSRKNVNIKHVYQECLNIEYRMHIFTVSLVRCIYPYSRPTR